MANIWSRFTMGTCDHLNMLFGEGHPFSAPNHEMTQSGEPDELDEQWAVGEDWGVTALTCRGV